MLDRELVNEYKKIKPSDGFKDRLAYRIAAETDRSARKPLYLRMRPVLSGALACVLLVCCLSVLPFNMLEDGNISVAYAQTGETITPASLESRVLSIAEFDYDYCEYSKLPDGRLGAEFTFEFDGKTEIKTEYGSVYMKNAYGSYEDIGNKARMEGNVTLLWAMPEGETAGESVMTIKNRSGEMSLILERTAEEYKANLVLAE